MCDTLCIMATNNNRQTVTIRPEIHQRLLIAAALAGVRPGFLADRILDAAIPEVSGGPPAESWQGPPPEKGASK